MVSVDTLVSATRDERRSPEREREENERKARGERPVGGLLLSRSKREAEPRGHPHQVRKRAGLHLSHHLASVCLHADLACAQLVTNLFVQKAGDNQCHDLALPTGELGVTFAQRLYCRLPAK